MAYDLIVRNGMIVDGTGFARYRADVGVKDGRITEIGRIHASAPTMIDADGQFVAPGIVSQLDAKADVKLDPPDAAPKP